MRFPFAGALAALALTLGLAANLASAHEGHDHSAPASTVTTPAAPRASASSTAFELVAIARGEELFFYLDRFETNEPVTGAAITVDGPEGTASAAPQEDGSYRLSAPWAAPPGSYDALATVAVDGTADVFPLTLTIPEIAAAGAAPTEPAWPRAAALAQELRDRLARKDPVVVAAAGGGLLLGMVLMLVMRRSRWVPAVAVLGIAVIMLIGTQALAHEGEEHGNEDHTPAPAAAAGLPPARDLAQRQPDGRVFVPKPTQRILSIRTVVAAFTDHRRVVELPGRIIPDPNASGLVQAAAGGRLSPPPAGFLRLGAEVRKGDVLAYVTPPLQTIDLSDLRQRQGELDQQIAIVERRIARYEPLARQGAVAQVQLEETRLELEGLKDRRRALDRIRTEPEPLVAPISGVIAEANAVAGQVVQGSTVVFQIVDPARLWVEALSFEPVASGAPASARLENGRSLNLAYQGSGLANRNQASPVQFAIQGDTGGLRVGQFVTVLAPTSDEKAGLAVSRAGIVRGSNGQDLVYEHTAPELFEPREVRVEPLDGERVLILAGVKGGSRIVTQGAELLDQVR